jgi:hypothetical protein
MEEIQIRRYIKLSLQFTVYGEHGLRMPERIALRLWSD